MGCGASCQVDNIDSLEVGSKFFLWSYLALSKQSIVDQSAMDQGKKTCKNLMYEEDMSHLATDYSYTSGRTAREKGFLVGILNEDELLPNNNRPSREGTRWFSHSIEIVPDSRRGWHWGGLGSSFNTQRMNPSR